ncbi:MAG: alpha-amylase family glycosyl hydrolase [Candidatus Dormibacteria bacterium]
MQSIDAAWWRSAVIYQVYPRSFKDSNRDGIGDLRGVEEKLDYLSWLGISAVWFNPTFPSPNTDWGYDISDYYGVHPDFGTVDDLRHLIEAAGKRNIRIILDLVPNHTSEKHPWFIDAMSSRDAAHRDWYVFADGKGNGPPNNWIDVRGECAWIHDPNSGQWYLHNFLASQPDLNWWNEDLRREFTKILSFWFDCGIAGFRIDVAHGVIKDKELRNNPETVPDHTIGEIHYHRQIQKFNAHRPEVHEIYRSWRELARQYSPERLLYGETDALTIEETASYYGTDDEFQLTLNSQSVKIPGTIPALAHAIRETEEAFAPTSWPSWTGSNHDIPRFPTRWGSGNIDRARCFLLMLLTLRGTPVLYYGDELCMQDEPMDPKFWKDPMYTPSRDSSRTPMPWSSAPNGGFTDDDIVPWLPISRHLTPSVAEQQNDPDSPLALTRRMIAFRSRHAEFTLSPYVSLVETSTLWAWNRGDSHIVVMNIGDKQVSCSLPSGRKVIATHIEEEGKHWNGTYVNPHEAFIVEIEQ